jgi:septal ring factor EnvC (AmiA/AmiB activator)
MSKIYAVSLFMTNLLFGLSTFGKTISREDFLVKSERVREQVQQVESQRRQVLAEIYETNRALKEAQRTQAKLDQEISLIELTNSELARDIQALQAQVSEQKRTLSRRLNHISKNNNRTIEAVLFSSTSSAQFERNLKIHKAIAQKDAALIGQLQANKTQVEKEKLKLQNRLSHLKKLQHRSKSQEVQLAQKAVSKKNLVDRLRREYKSQEALLTATRKKAALDPELSAYLRPTFFEQRGELSWPVTGQIQRGFGVLRDPEFNVTLPHPGVLLSSKQERSALAVYDGVVQFVGPLADYTNVIIIDHGDNYFSVYGHVSDPRVSLGQSVLTGQEIAKLEHDPAKSAYQMYFEIRHFSEPLDPARWMRRSTQ